MILHVFYTILQYVDIMDFSRIVGWLVGYVMPVCIWEGPKYSYHVTGFSIDKEMIFKLKKSRTHS